MNWLIGCTKKGCKCHDTKEDTFTCSSCGKSYTFEEYAGVFEGKCYCVWCCTIAKKVVSEEKNG
jgi:hypothetical protein